MYIDKGVLVLKEASLKHLSGNMSGAHIHSCVQVHCRSISEDRSNETNFKHDTNCSYCLTYITYIELQTCVIFYIYNIACNKSCLLYLYLYLYSTCDVFFFLQIQNFVLCVFSLNHQDR